MKRQLALVLLSGALVTTSGALAHHSFAMFDQKNPIELVGTVQEFKYVNPHCYLLLEVKGADGSAVGTSKDRRLPCSPAKGGQARRSSPATNCA